MSKDTRRSKCPVNHAIEMLGDRWTMLVIRDMVFHAKKSFSELRDMPEGIASNILADRLVRLEGDGLVYKQRDPADGRRTVYELTPHGRALIPVLLELMVWSRSHTDDVDMSESVAEAIKQDRSAAVAEIEARLAES